MTYREMLTELQKIPEKDLDAAVKYFDGNTGEAYDVVLALGEELAEDDTGNIQPHLPLIVQS